MLFKSNTLYILLNWCFTCVCNLQC